MENLENNVEQVPAGRLISRLTVGTAPPPRQSAIRGLINQLRKRSRRNHRCACDRPDWLRNRATGDRLWAPGSNCWRVNCGGAKRNR